MAREVLGVRRATILLVAAFALGAQAADRDLKTPKTPWKSLSGEDQRVLAPLAGEWEQLPGYQQQRLRSAAKQYPKMQPIQRVQV